jgi:hypothetical protein
VFQFLNYRNPFALIFLLLFIIALKLPTFHDQHFGSEESSLIIASQRMLAGGLLYQDIWESRPPLMLWMYAGFNWLFGIHVLMAIKIFAVLYLIVFVLFFNHFIASFRQSPDISVYPGFLLALYLSTPWYIQEASSTYFSLLPMFAAILLLIQHYVDEKSHWSNLFVIGILCGICTAISYQGLLHLFCIFLAYFISSRPNLKDIVTLSAGFLLVAIVVILPLYFQGVLDDFFDLSILFSLDILQSRPLPLEFSQLQQLLTFVILISPLLLMGLFGYLSHRGGFTATTIRQRRVEAVLSVWLVFSLITFFINIQHKNAPQFLIIIIPVVFYGLIYTFRIKRAFWLSFMQLLLIMMPAAMFWLIITSIFLNAKNDLGVPLNSTKIIVNQVYDQYNVSVQEELLKEDIASVPIKNGILITDYLPEMYLKLNKFCASKYADFYLAYYKLDWLKVNQYRTGLISQSEDIAAVYRTFQREKPDYIIDSNGIFKEIRTKIPILLKDYKTRQVGRFQVYSKE